MASSYTESKRDHVELQTHQQVAEGEKFLHVTLRGHPVNMSKTGTWKAAPFVYAFVVGSSINIILGFTSVTYLVTYFHLPIAKAATTTTNQGGTSFILAIFGAFIADSYLGSFWTILGGGLIAISGLGLLTLISTSSGMHLRPCTPNTPCSPAGARYMVPVYFALYAIALGGGLVSPNLLSLGADQFDGSKSAEQKQGAHFFAWFFFFTHMSFLVAVFLAVYFVTNVSPGWGYGFTLMFYTSGFLIFLAGFPKLRHRRPAGSFLTRTAQVLVAALRKRNSSTSRVGIDDLYDPHLPQATAPKLVHTQQLRFLDRAAIINEEEKENEVSNPWRLCSVSQVEETKRILHLIPVWATISGVTIVYSQLSTFTITQAQTYDRKLGPHVTLPAASVTGILTITSLILVPVYDRLVVPIVRRLTKNPYGFLPLKLLGSSIVFAGLTMVSAALIERRRLVTVREMHFEGFELGTYVLPLKFWWLLPQYVLGAFVEFTFFVSGAEFFYHESSDTTRSIGTAFIFSAVAIGNFFSTILVQTVNKVTRHHPGDGWLEGQLNNGGLEKFYWLLAVLLCINFLAYLTVSSVYRYKYDWYQERRLQRPEVQISVTKVSTTEEGN